MIWFNSTFIGGLSKLIHVMLNKSLWHEMTSWLDMWCELIRRFFWKYLILSCMIAKIWLNFQFYFLTIRQNSIFEIALIQLPTLECRYKALQFVLCNK